MRTLVQILIVLSAASEVRYDGPTVSGEVAGAYKAWFEERKPVLGLYSLLVEKQLKFRSRCYFTASSVW